MTNKEYLGDGVYVSPDNGFGGIVLTTENGISTTNRIVLEPSVISALEEYLQNMTRCSTCGEDLDTFVQETNKMACGRCDDV